jgi:hypothetical protein
VGGLRIVVAAWREVMWEEVEKREAEERIKGLIMHGEQSQEAQELAKQQMEEAVKAHRSMVQAAGERRGEMCKRVVQRMLKHQLLMAWNMFVDTVRQTQHNRSTVRKMLSRLTHLHLARVWNCFAGAVDILVAQRERVSRTVGRWKSPKVKKAWERWEAYLQDVWQERATKEKEVARQQLEEAVKEHQSVQSRADAEVGRLRCRAMDQWRRRGARLILFQWTLLAHRQLTLRSVCYRSFPHYFKSL